VVAAGLFILAIFRKRHLKTPFVLAAAVLGIIGTISLVGLQVRGFKGEPITLEFMYAMARASFGLARGGDSWLVWSAAGGVTHRVDWWTGIVDQLTAGPVNFLFGLGYGHPLTDHLWYGVAPLREPHNSYLSIFARIGLVGFVLWCWVHVCLLRAWHTAYTWARKNGSNNLQTYLIVIMVYFAGIWVTAIGEDPLEKPFNITPHYFFWGVVLRFAAAAEREEKRRERRRSRGRGSRIRDRGVSKEVDERGLLALAGKRLGLPRLRVRS
jgi:O-antigen ligase